ncbi:DUF4381 domain-containing protein [Spongiibacter taiwanensis]|uniref:DUF4381 domain-containing protein n=1 Tax=Spongiibacter taiwanensis TaxID=1748242 RepID=UPI002034CED7|nr:DUF4381 domain-containing protein [Spongiibacter taiwanensis]USA42286.1 DUF4381 domain-containing protein [Spongiibacter taiwanensis]
MSAPTTTAHLADIHLPEPVSWFPPAPGWWALAGITLLLAVAISWALRRRHLQRAHRRQAIAELGKLKRQTNPHLLAQQINPLLRQVALHNHPRRDIAHLSGLAWAQWLAGSGHISPDNARELVEAAYNPNAVLTDRDALLDQCERWIDKSRPAASQAGKKTLPEASDV